MPVVHVSTSRLLRLIGANTPLEQIVRALEALKCEVEVQNDKLVIEVQSDRPDMFSTEGIARAIKLYMELEEPRIPMVKSYPIKVYVTPPRKRPYIAVAAVTNVDLSNGGLEELIQFQEKLHITYGRKRRKVAIGLHDLDKVPTLELSYRYENIHEVKFVPLHQDKEMTLDEVLRKLEQGMEYGSISLDGDLHPVIRAGSEVISVPPVINAELTRITPNTKNILIDVTGPNLDAVLQVLNIIVSNLAVHGGEVIGAEVVYGDTGEVIRTPTLKPEEWILNRKYVSEVLGLDMSIDDICKSLRKLGHIVEKKSEEEVRILVPPYRIDILHPIDLVEDCAIGLGYENLVPENIEIPFIHPLSPRREIENTIRTILVGLGYIELNTFTMISSQIVEATGFREYLRIENPLTIELDALRPSLIPSILLVLKYSLHASVPVKVFEIGYGVVRDKESYTGWKNRLLLAIAIMDSIIKFEDIHADVYALLKELGLEPRFYPCLHPALIKGRTACIKVDGDTIGVLGEVNPEILEKLEIRYPVAIAELDLNKLLDLILK